MSDLKQTYPYALDFQHALLALSVQDPAFLGSYRDCLDPRFFEDKSMQFLSGMIVSFWNQYGQPPQQQSLVEAIRQAQHSGRAKNLPDTIYDTTQRLYTMELSDADFLRDRALRFAQRQELKKMVKHGIEVLQKDGNPQEAMDLYQRALSLGTDRDPGIDLWEVIGRLGEMWQAMVAERGRIPTVFLPTLDEALYGGPRRGELYVFQAVPKAGKSMCLINIGAWALYYGRRVAHLTIGDLKQFDVALRYAARLTSTSIKDIMNNKPHYMETLRETKLSPSQIHIKYYSPGTLTTGHIRSYLSWLQSNEGFHPDVLIVDYPDKMKHDASHSYSELGRIYMELKALLDDFNCVGWVASQSNRAAAHASQNTVANMAESWDKAANADGIMPISQTDQERQNSRFRLSAEMLRFGADHWHVECSYDWPRCTITQTDKSPDSVAREQDERIEQAARAARKPGPQGSVSQQAAAVTGSTPPPGVIVK